MISLPKAIKGIMIIIRNVNNPNILGISMVTFKNTLIFQCYSNVDMNIQLDKGKLIDPR